jgi:hypothetical protein
MTNRNDLISYLNSAPLSTTNVLQLLNLGVVEVLQEGGYCRRAEEACDRLKDLLFRKYFPNDFKPKPVPDRKVYRKKKSGRTAREEEKSELQPIMNPEECRKKTIAKLHKFLMRQPSSQSEESRPAAKEISVQIEAAFFQFDSTMGDNYKSLALKVLGALKVLFGPYRMVQRMARPCCRNCVGGSTVSDVIEDSIINENYHHVASFLWTNLAQSSGVSMTLPMKLNAI